MKMIIANRSDWEDVLRRKTAKNEEEYQRKMNVVFEVLGIDPTKGTPMKKLKPDYINARDKIIALKEKSEVKETLKDFDKKLAGAYYFGKSGVPDDQIKEKFDMTGKEAEEKIKSILSDCENL